MTHRTRPRPPFDPRNWYWAVAGSTTQVYSSAAGAYVQLDDPTYVAWLSVGGRLPTSIATEALLWEVLANQAPDLVPAAGLSVKQTIMASGLPRVVLQLLFSQENRILTLEGKPTLTPAQFAAAIKSRLS